MKKGLLLLFSVAICGTSAYAVELPDIDLPEINLGKVKEKISEPFRGDARQQEMRYVHELQKQEAKEKYEKRVLERNPSGFLTGDVYELFSVPKDKTVQD